MRAKPTESAVRRPLSRPEIMRRVRSRDTAPERDLRKALRQRGLRYRLCDRRLPGKPDVVLPEHRLAIFIDGDYWHGNQWRRRGLACLEDQFPATGNRAYWLRKIRRNVARDFAHTAALLRRGWRVMRLWESEWARAPERYLDRIEDAVQQRASSKRKRSSMSGAAYPSLADRTVAEFFAGVGLVRLALEQEGWRTVFANDIDPDKQEIYERNFARDGEPSVFRLEDIHALPAAEIPSAALATASFPCTDLSLAGERRGLAGRHSSAFWGFVRILDELGGRRPPLILLENVQGFLTSHGGADFAEATAALSRLGYWLDAYLINADAFTPQSRPRVFVVGMIERDIEGLTLEQARDERSQTRPPRLLQAIAGATDARWRLAPAPPLPGREEETDLLGPTQARRRSSRVARRHTLGDIVENVESGSALWWSEDRVARLLEQMTDLNRSKAESLRQGSALAYATVFRRMRAGKSRAEIRDDGLAGCLRTPRGGSSRQILLVAGHGEIRVRLLTPRECARLQGVPDSFDLSGIGLNQALFGIGDAVCVPAVAWLARHILDPIAASLLRGRILEP